MFHQIYAVMNQINELDKSLTQICGDTARPNIQLLQMTFNPFVNNIKQLAVDYNERRQQRRQTLTMLTEQAAWMSSFSGNPSLFLNAYLCGDSIEKFEREYHTYIMASARTMAQSMLYTLDKVEARLIHYGPKSVTDNRTKQAVADATNALRHSLLAILHDTSNVALRQTA